MEARNCTRADRNPSVILIGNGASVLDHQVGAHIDSFDIIIRLNNFQLVGYESYVGSRTTIWARTIARDVACRVPQEFASVLICAPRWAAQRCVPFWVRLKRRYDVLSLKRLTRMYPGCEVASLETLARAEAGLGIRNHRRQWPSTGIFALVHAIETYGKVWIHGMDHFQTIDGAARHYFNGREVVGRSYPHLPDAERLYVERLMQEGVVGRLVA